MKIMKMAFWIVIWVLGFLLASRICSWSLEMIGTEDNLFIAVGATTLVLTVLFAAAFLIQVWNKARKWMIRAGL